MYFYFSFSFSQPLAFFRLRSLFAGSISARSFAMLHSSIHYNQQPTTTTAIPRRRALKVKSSPTICNLCLPDSNGNRLEEEGEREAFLISPLLSSLPSLAYLFGSPANGSCGFASSITTTGLVCWVQLACFVHRVESGLV